MLHYCTIKLARYITTETEATVISEINLEKSFGIDVDANTLPFSFFVFFLK
jgi:hypothetical protein